MLLAKIILGYFIFLLTIISFFFSKRMHNRITKLSYLILVAVSMFIFLKFSLWKGHIISVASICNYCFLFPQCFGNAPALEYKIFIEFFYFVYQHTFIIFPTFILGTLLVGFSSRYYRLPFNFLTAVLGGILLPVCSCGVFPLVRRFLGEKNINAGAVITFLFITPMLSLYTIFISYSLLGLRYTLARIIGSVIIAVVGGFIVTNLKEFKKMKEKVSFRLQNRKEECFLVNNYFTICFSFFVTMVKYILLGILIGSFFSTFLPPQFVGNYLTNNRFGLLFITLIAFPLHICGGQEVVILYPLAMLGLPLSYQLSFTFAGTGICMSVIPLYYDLLGKRITLMVMLYYFLSSLFISWFFNRITLIFC